MSFLFYSGHIAIISSVFDFCLGEPDPLPAWWSSSFCSILKFKGNRILQLSVEYAKSHEAKFINKSGFRSLMSVSLAIMTIIFSNKIRFFSLLDQFWVDGTRWEFAGGMYNSRETTKPEKQNRGKSSRDCCHLRSKTCVLRNALYNCEEYFAFRNVCTSRTEAPKWVSFSMTCAQNWGTQMGDLLGNVRHRPFWRGNQATCGKENHFSKKKYELFYEISYFLRENTKFHKSFFIAAEVSIPFISSKQNFWFSVTLSDKVFHNNVI